jgi:hypothetical protein
MVILTADPPLEDAANKFEDLSGVKIKPGDNPYNALINACDGSPVSSLFISFLEKTRCWIMEEKRPIQLQRQVRSSMEAGGARRSQERQGPPDSNGGPGQGPDQELDRELESRGGPVN